MMSTNRARKTVGMAHSKATASATVLSTASSSTVRFTKNHRLLYFIRTVAISANAVNAANGTMLLRLTITALMLCIGNS